MKTRILILTTLMIGFAFFTGCEEKDSGQTGVLNLSLTDAPVDQPNITGVHITLQGLEYHKQDNSWATFEEWGGPKSFNLLDLTDGVSTLLGDFEMDAGQYNQLRFTLDAPIRGEGTPESPGCYIEFEDGTTAPLYVASAEHAGFKLTGAFKVPSNGTVELTADFDARKSVAESSTGEIYILRPAVRMIANNEAGQIAGGITGFPTDGSDIIVYAYEDGTYTAEEAAEPGAEEIRFSNAITSDMSDAEQSYHLYYLAPMTYDLVVVSSLEGQFQEVEKVIEDVVVESKETTPQPIELSAQ